MWNTLKSMVRENKLISVLLLALFLVALWRAFQGDFNNLLSFGLATSIGATAGALERRRQAKRRQAEQQDLENTDAIIAEAERRAAADEKISRPHTSPPTDLWDSNAKLPPP